MTQAAVAPSVEAVRAALPRSYMAWTLAASVSTLGSAVLSFGSAWYASGFGEGTAGLVATMVIAPRVVLLLVGGAVADRWGPRRVMVAGDAVMCAAALAVALAAAMDGVTVSLLVAIAAISGIVDAFYLPAAGAMPRLFVAGGDISRALAVRTGLSQIAYLSGPALGALVVVTVGLAGAATADAVTFGLVLIVLLAVRPPLESASSASEGGHLLGGIASSLRAMWADPFLRPVLGSMGLLAGAVLPMFGLGVPLLVRYRGWDAAAAGWIEGGWFVGTLSVTVLIARVGAHRRAGLVGAVTPLVAAIGTAMMYAGRSPAVVATGAVVLGVGVALCTSHLGPLFVTSSPRDQLSRFQSVFVLVQMVPLLVSNGVFAWLAGRFGAPVIFVASSGLTVLTSGCLLLSRPVRTAASPGRD
ncbi:MFS transporter [Luteipulveratus mongoliensis]|uniref:Major facilitator superfamily (MFS) profile domain-containing protein n=1 Tax=Luteipulveratus mongoliensis TaxID=571913 RepID=A0A0K1JFB2_9MICO|nr:MFS transporter [Luteipulveratus mongoliensis]AKU15399.1 hypothetical protein VV02_05170 [Luteipulveratus mongoliensis]